MRLREEIKMQAKAAFKLKYGVNIAVLLVGGVIIGFASYLGPVSLLVIIPISLGVVCHFTSVFYGGSPEIATMFQQGFGFNYVFDLSSLGWHLLSALTFGLLEIFYVGPYQSTAAAGYLGDLIENAVREGVIVPNDLNKILYI